MSANSQAKGLNVWSFTSMSDNQVGGKNPCHRPLTILWPCTKNFSFWLNGSIMRPLRSSFVQVTVQSIRCHQEMKPDSADSWSWQERGGRGVDILRSTIQAEWDTHCQPLDLQMHIANHCMVWDQVLPEITYKTPLISLWDGKRNWITSSPNWIMEPKQHYCSSTS